MIFFFAINSFKVKHPNYFFLFNSRIPMQADDAEQDEAGTGGLRGREPGTASENVFQEVGIHLHASRSASQVSLTILTIILPLQFKST